MATNSKPLSISTDSTADLDSYEKCDLKVVPTIIIVGDETFQDGVDITPADIFNSVEQNKIMPKTAAASEEDYAKVFARANGQPHLHIALSSMFSASCENAMRAAAKFPNVTLINSGHMSNGLGILCLIARELADKGKTPAEIVEVLKTLIPKVHSSFVVESLTYLYRGGRCSGLKMAIAQLLNLHPMIYVEPNGRMLPGRTFKGKFAEVVKNYTKFILQQNPNPNKDLALISYTTIDPVILKQVEDDLRAAGFKHLNISVLGGCISAHCGRNTIGIAFCNL